ncbi:MAG: hypothetical protein OSB03_16550, partial [Vicinamibacterales bacterium]|nr:hypothetical protein [Vicinamibacterales bacterium]
GCHINDNMNDEDDLPLSSLWRESKSPKRKGKTKTSRSPSPRRRHSKGKAPKKTTLRVYGLNGDCLGDVTDIAAFKIAHKQDIPAQIGFVVLGPAGGYMIDNQQQLDAIPAGNYPAHAVFVHPTEAQLRAFNRRRTINDVSKRARSSR